MVIKEEAMAVEDNSSDHEDSNHADENLFEELCGDLDSSDLI